MSKKKKKKTFWKIWKKKFIFFFEKSNPWLWLVWVMHDNSMSWRNKGLVWAKEDCEWHVKRQRPALLSSIQACKQDKAGDLFWASYPTNRSTQLLKYHSIITLLQGLLYHRTCKRDFLCSWPSLNSYLK